MATKKAAAAPQAASPFDPPTQEKLDAFAALHGTTPEKIVALAVKEWLADYDRGRWPHSHSDLEPNPTLA